MTKEEEKNLQKLETRLRQLILTYKELEAAHQELQNDLRLKEEQIVELEADNRKWQEKYENLKLAGLLEVSGEDAAAARQRIGRLIKEVDKCIALLNV